MRAHGALERDPGDPHAREERKGEERALYGGGQTGERTARKEESQGTHDEGLPARADRRVRGEDDRAQTQGERGVEPVERGYEIAGLRRDGRSVCETRRREKGAAGGAGCGLVRLGVRIRGTGQCRRAMGG